MTALARSSPPPACSPPSLAWRLRPPRRTCPTKARRPFRVIDTGDRQGDGHPQRQATKPRGIALAATVSALLPTRPRMRSWSSTLRTARRWRRMPLGDFAGSDLPVARRQVAVGGGRGERPGDARRHRGAEGRSQDQDARQESRACGVQPGRQMALRQRRGSGQRRHRRPRAKDEVVKSVKVGDRPRGIGFLPDGSRAYVAAENADTVNVFDTATQEVIATIKAGSRSNGVLVHPDGKRVYVTSGRQRHGAGDRHGDQCDRRRDPRRQASVEHGDHAGRQQALRRVRALQRGRRGRHGDQRARSRRLPSAHCRGAWRSAERAAAARHRGGARGRRVRHGPGTGRRPGRRCRCRRRGRRDHAAAGLRHAARASPVNVQIFGARDLRAANARRRRVPRAEREQRDADSPTATRSSRT